MTDSPSTTTRTSTLARSVLVLALPLGLLGCSRGGDELPLPGTLARDRIELAAHAAEPVLAWNVAEGQKVAAGTVLIRLDPGRAEAALARAKATREKAKRRVDELARGPRPEVLADLQARYDGAKVQLETDERELKRQTELAARQLSSQAAVDIQRAARDRSLTARDSAKAQLAAGLKGTTVEELDQARATLVEAEADERDATIALERLTVVAPTSGTVDALPFRVGERPAQGQPVAVLLADDRIYARVFVPEPLRARVVPGLAATVKVDGIESPFPATVRRVSSEAAYTPYYSLTERDRSRLAFRAEVDLAPSAASAALPAGVPLDVDFPSLHD